MGFMFNLIAIGLLIISAIILFFCSRKEWGKILIFFGIALFLMALKYILNLLHIYLPILIFDILTLFGAILFLIVTLSLRRISREMERKSIHLKGLWEMDRILLSGLTSKSIMEAIKKTIVEIVDCNALAIYTIDAWTGDFILYNNYNLNDTFHSGVLSQGKDFLKEVITSKKTICTRGTGFRHKDFLSFIQNFGFNICAGVPLVIRGMPIGTLLIFSQRKRGYEKQEIEYIEGIARQLVVTMDRIQTFEKMKEMTVESVQALVQAIEMRDPSTRGHSAQVAELALELARRMEFPDRKLILINFAGLLHDVGKIAVPEDILRKPEALNLEEWRIVKNHPIHSMNIVKPIKNLAEISKWILYHHERWDGSGYPEGLRKEAIPLESRILAICDAFSAMVSDRPYRKGLTLEFAIEEIKKCAGQQFDPGIVKIFLNIPEEFLKNFIRRNF